jgi:Lon protease-like protein
MHDSSANAGACEILTTVPLFPLPNVVLFPRAVLPLHIFEERYKSMTADALAGRKLIAMALLKPGWEKSYYCRPPIESVVCIGKIISCERLPDGKYNFLLQGQSRATIVTEHDSHTPYRISDLQPLPEPPIMEIDLSNQRLRLTSIFSDDVFSAASLGRQFLQMLSSPLSTIDIADLIAFNLFDSPCLKQKLLAETDVHRRVQRVIDALEALRPGLESTKAKRCSTLRRN